MPDDTAATRQQPIKEGVTNPTRGSKVQAQAEYAPMLFLRPMTGEIIGVPTPDVATVNTEIGEWNMLMATLHYARAQVQFFEEELRNQVLTPDLLTPGALDTAQKNFKLAFEWHKEVMDKCQFKMKSLARLGSGGKELVELIPLSGAPARNAENKPGEYKDGKYKKERKITWGKGAKSTVSREWIRPRKGPMVYVASDKLKPDWPTFKDAGQLKWTDVVPKDGNGRRRIRHDKLIAYTEQALKSPKFKAKDFVNLSVDVKGALGGWATAWNTDTANKFSGEGKLAAGRVTGDMEFDAGAQFMRYLYGGSLDATFEPFKGNVSFRAEGHAEVALAEAKASASVYFPRKEGWMWTMPSVLTEKGASAKDIDLGAVRFMAEVTVKGAVGASIAAELNIGVETKVGQLPAVLGIGTSKDADRLTKTVSVVDTPGSETKMRVWGADAKLDAFVGLKADGEIKGAMEWRNPETEKKKFEAFATVAPTVGGMAGAGATGKLAVQYVGGVFRFEAHAAICIGLGAEGKLSFEVSGKLLLSFVKWFFYQLYHANFKRLSFIGESAFKVASYLPFLAIAQGEKILDNFGISELILDRKIREIDKKLAAPMARKELADRVLAGSDFLRYAPPETKGMLIYHLCRCESIDQGMNVIVPSDDPSIMQRAAIKNIIESWSHTRADCENVIQHISPTGQKGSQSENIGRLRDFYNKKIPGKRKLSGVFEGTEDFDAWHERLIAILKEEPTRGFPVVQSNSMQYAMQRDDRRDHPLFSSESDGAYYA